MQKVTIQRNRKRQTVKEFASVYGVGLFLAIIILVIAYQFVAPAPPNKLTIATASAEGGYFAFAKEYKRYFANENIELEILETSGSIENLTLLHDKKVEVAFVQSGVGSEGEYTDLKGVASLYLEPLWIFVRSGLEIQTLQDLAGKRLAIGPAGSGTREIALQLLADNQLLEAGKIELVDLGGKEGAAELLAGNIDAFFTVTRVESSLVHELFIDARATLVNLARAESYTRLHSYLTHIVIPVGVLDMANNIPSRDIHLVAPSATLVVNDQIHPALVDLLMQIITKVHKDATAVATDETFPSPHNLDFELSQEAERFFRNGPPFLQRYLPFWAASLFDRLKVMLLPLIALILPLMKILPPTYRWRMRSKIYRWYEELHELDVDTKKNATPDVITNAIAVLNEMEQEVRQVDVPLSYAQELYNLRLHIDMLRKQIARLARTSPQ